ncbi:MAG: glycerophosphodiester phosphodiesterase, partial [Candidatus Limnocylindrales bacterium]
MSRRRTLRLAHRGDWRAAPENTLAAFRAALGRPACDGLEFDVRVSADGVPVVCHDDSLVRVQGRPERVDSLGADALSRFDVPTLAEVLEVAGRRPFLDVELKVEMGHILIEVLAAGRGPELHNAVVSSFEPAALDGVARRVPGWPRWLNVEVLDRAAIAAAIELRCRGVAAEWHSIDAESAALARAARLEVAAWTVRRRATFDRLADLGVDAVCVEANAL